MLLSAIGILLLIFAGHNLIQSVSAALLPGDGQTLT